MTITNGYIDLATLKADLIIKPSDPVDDTRLERIIEAVSRAIDKDRKRRFYTTTSDETRYFTAEFGHRCVIADLLTLTTLKTDLDGDGTYETTWASTDYNLFPYNATLNDEPYLAIEKAIFGVNFFPTHLKGVQVVGKFGYCTLTNITTAAPGIREAALLMCQRVRQRKDLIFGIAGNAELGTLQAIDKLMRDGEIQFLLNSVARRRL